MPSGAKKRKAAKKKKQQQQQHNTVNNNPRGTDDPRSQDERESEGEVGSPASQESDNHQHPFSKGNGESEKLDQSASAAQSLLTDKDSPKEEEAETTVEIENDSSSGSSSDDESLVFKKKEEDICGTVDIPAESLLEEAKLVGGNLPLQGVEVGSILETIPEIESDKPVVADIKEVIHVESKLKGNGKKFDDSTVVEGTSKGKPEKVFPFSDENAHASSGLLEPVPSAPVSETKKGVEGIKESQYSEKETLLPTPRPIVQRTSWLSCCGLFDVVSGSSR